MNLNNGTNVRMDQETHDRVNKIAKRYRIKKSDIIRNALYEALPKWEREGVKLVAAQPGAN
jgi:predicted transcriptional regulator